MSSSKGGAFGPLEDEVTSVTTEKGALWGRIGEERSIASSAKLGEDNGAEGVFTTAHRIGVIVAPSARVALRVHDNGIGSEGLSRLVASFVIVVVKSDRRGVGG